MKVPCCDSGGSSFLHLAATQRCPLFHLLKNCTWVELIGKYSWTLHATMVQSTGWKKVKSVSLDSRTPKGPGIVPIVWDLKLCPFEPYTNVLAVVVSSDVHIMRAGLETGLKRLSSCNLQPQQPGEGNESENIYCCEWILLSDGCLCLVVGGHSGIIYLLNAAEDLELERVIQGHGSSIVRIRSTDSMLVCLLLPMRVAGHRGEFTLHITTSPCKHVTRTPLSYHCQRV